MVEYEKVMREEKGEETGKGKGKGLLERLFGKRSKCNPCKLDRSEDKPSSESRAELEAKTFIESENECSQSPSISSDSPGIEDAAASILSKYFTYLLVLPTKESHFNMTHPSLKS